MVNASQPPGTPRRIAVIGGGAAGFFAALAAAEGDPGAQVSIYERSRQYLSKVRVSGGGRCNVTHSCFDPARLATHYPRGARELRGAFHRWQPKDTIDWFSERGVALKTEADGRMFPVTDDSQTIIDCFMESARSSRVELHDKQALSGLSPRTRGGFDLDFGEAGTVSADAVCVACGSLKDSPLTRALESLGHTIEPLAPSLFAMNISDSRLHGLSGISVQDASVCAGANGRPQNGPLLITHRGMSGPAILRLSAWEARSLQALDYRFELAVNWLGDVTKSQLQEVFARFRRDSGKAGVRRRGLEIGRAHV